MAKGQTSENLECAILQIVMGPNSKEGTHEDSWGCWKPLCGGSSRMIRSQRGISSPRSSAFEQEALSPWKSVTRIGAVTENTPVTKKTMWSSFCGSHSGLRLPTMVAAIGTSSEWQNRLGLLASSPGD